MSIQYSLGLNSKWLYRLTYFTYLLVSPLIDYKKERIIDYI